MEPIKTIETGNGIRALIYPDDNPESPREWDNLGTMVCFHPRYNLGDEKHGFTPETLAEKLQEPGLVWLSLYLYDHSGISISCGEPSLLKDDSHYFFDPGGWDTSLIGAIFVDAETIKREYGDAPDAALRVLDCLRSEVNVYDMYLRGDVNGYVIEDAAGNVLDSCWEFYGEEEVEEEAMIAAAYHVRRNHDHEYGYCRELGGI
jgi:hypothetical protein